MKKVVITGADGFIGSNLIKYLVKNNIEVYAIICPSSLTKSRIQGMEKVHCIECEIAGLIAIAEDFPKDIDVCFHLAWQGVAAEERDNLNKQMKNIDMGLLCIEFASKIQVKNIIFLGSTAEYLYYGKPINELAVPSPQNAYATAKVALHYLAKQYAQNLQIGYIYVVITGIYAADRKDNNVIFYTIEKLLNGEKPALTKLEQLWDYVNIKDVVEALRLIGEKGKSGAFYAVGRGDNQPLYKYIETIRNYIDPTLPLGIGEVEYANDRMPSSCIDLSAVTRDTGFVPKVSFDDGIKEVIDIMRKEKEELWKEMH